MKKISAFLATLIIFAFSSSPTIAQANAQEHNPASHCSIFVSPSEVEIPTNLRENNWEKIKTIRMPAESESEQLEEIFNSINISPDTHAGGLSLEDWERIKTRTKTVTSPAESGQPEKPYFIFIYSFYRDITRSDIEVAVITVVRFFNNGNVIDLSITWQVKDLMLTIARDSITEKSSGIGKKVCIRSIYGTDGNQYQLDGLMYRLEDTAENQASAE